MYMYVHVKLWMGLTVGSSWQGSSEQVDSERQTLQSSWFPDCPAVSCSEPHPLWLPDSGDWTFRLLVWRGTLTAETYPVGP